MENFNYEPCPNDIVLSPSNPKSPQSTKYLQPIKSQAVKKIPVLSKIHFTRFTSPIQSELTPLPEESDGLLSPITRNRLPLGAQRLPPVCHKITLAPIVARTYRSPVQGEEQLDPEQ